MLLTEKEAREKECRTGGVVTTYTGKGAVVDSILGIGVGWPRCSASDCMTGWRWWNNPTAGKVFDVQDKGDFFLVSKDELQQFINNALRPSPDRLGYCGLAGKVEE